jgi:putative membrane protein insertion efficiency factor
MKKMLLLIIRFYQYFISPMLGGNCRFHPTCSDYAKDAIVIHGSFKGSCMALYRIVRCQPFCSGGFDPVVNKKQ